MKAIAVANPKSGSGTAVVLMENLLKAASFEIIPILENSAEDTRRELRSQINKTKPDVVIAIGGDGIVHLCIQEIFDQDIALHVIAAGTGNDFANTTYFGLADIDKSITHLRSFSEEVIDLGIVKTRDIQKVFVQVLSTGFDAIVNERANRIRFIRGRVKYTIATLLVLARFKPIEYEIEIDGSYRKLSAMLISVANGPTYGGGMRICPEAVRDDQKLDVIIIKPVSKFELLRVFPKVFSGGHVGHSQIEFHKVREISLSAKTLALADGEYISQLPIKVAIAGSRLKLVTNR